MKRGPGGHRDACGSAVTAEVRSIRVGDRPVGGAAIYLANTLMMTIDALLA
jgi:hypothetical protein